MNTSRNRRAQQIQEMNIDLDHFTLWSNIQYPFENELHRYLFWKNNYYKKAQLFPPLLFCFLSLPLKYFGMNTDMCNNHQFYKGYLNNASTLNKIAWHVLIILKANFKELTENTTYRKTQWLNFTANEHIFIVSHIF